MSQPEGFSETCCSATEGSARDCIPFVHGFRRKPCMFYFCLCNAVNRRTEVKDLRFATSVNKSWQTQGISSAST